MRRIEQQIAARIHHFDLQSLLLLLGHIGWRPDEIRFVSHCTTTSQASLIHDIEFTDDPSRTVSIVLNMGLLSAQSPLPSYFMRKLDVSAIDNVSFIEFLGYFDHAILGDYFRNVYPETNRNLFADWELTKRRYLHLLNLKSCSTLHWLFSTVFPDLGVIVEKATVSRGVRTAPIRLGESMLGSDSVFGKKAKVPVPGRRVTLLSDGEFTDWGTPWLTEIKQRLDELAFPIIGEVGIDLEILLTIQAQKSWARLNQESYLGYDKVKGGAEQERQIKLFSGHIVS